MNPENRKRILALAVVFVVIAALTSATPAPCSGDEHAAKVKEAAAQSVRAGKVFDAIMQVPTRLFRGSFWPTRRQSLCSRRSSRRLSLLVARAGAAS